MRKPFDDWLRLCMSLTVLCASIIALAAAAGQTPDAAKPNLDDPKAIDQGKHLFLGRCAVCHGIDARGYRGSDLTSSELLQTANEQQVFRVVSRGIPGTEMPESTLHDDEIWMIVAYLRTLRGSTKVDLRGDAANGERLYWSADKGLCQGCHVINGRGGRLGPELSRIGAARSREALIREIRRPSEYQAPGYEAVTVVTKDGKRIRGCRKNEDTFSIQMLAVTGALLTFRKADLKEVIEDTESVMPAYGPDQLTDAELDDLVRYLSTLRGQPTDTRE